MNIYIQGGKYKGLKISIAGSTSIRPTSNLVRESLFNILRKDNQEFIFYDLFTGSGAVGIEAASRGFEKVFLVENNLKLYLQIKALIGKKNINNICVIKSDVIKFLEKLLKENKINKEEYANIFFLDPPYKLNNLYKQTLIMLEKLAKKQNISIIIGETAKKMETFKAKGLSILQQRFYGDTRLDFYAIDDSEENKNE